MHVLRLLNVFCRTYNISSALLFFDPDGSLGLSVLQDYIKLRADTQAKNIAAWTPVVAEILDGFCRFDNKAVRDSLDFISSLLIEMCSLLDISPQYTHWPPSCLPVMLHRRSEWD